MRTVPGDIRFYCLCGLKMRITADMYGKPGKCVSCRQKFWVPQAKELPEQDNVVRLADHPELLRRTGERLRREPGTAEQERENAPILPPPEVMPEIASKDSAGGAGGSAAIPVAARLAAGVDAPPEPEAEEPTVPLDNLEPLRQILAYQYLADRQSPQGATEKGPGQTDTDTRRAYRRVIERAKTRVEQRLRELLYETGRRLAEVLGEIAQTTLRFRVGEITSDEYFETVGQLRDRREWLDRQRVNLKAWLRADNVHLLGGPGGVSMEKMNLNRVEVFLPAEEKEERTLLQKYIAELREAFDARAVAERRRTEWRRMVREGEMPEVALQEGPLQANADAQRAQARVTHCRARLRQVIRDCDTDISALQAYQQLLAKGALPRRRGELTQAELLEEARGVGQAITDLRVWRDWASNAASAEDPGDLPLSPATLFRRLAEPNELRRFARESIPAYTAALCLMLLALLPVAMAKTGFLAGMVLMAIVPAFSSRSRRGAAYVAIWIAETFLMGLAWRFAEAEPAARAYLAEPVHLVWMVLAAVGAWVSMGLSATLVLRKLAGGYAWAPPAAGAAGILLFLAALFLGGAPTASPKTATPPVKAESKPPSPPKPAEVTGPGATQPGMPGVETASPPVSEAPAAVQPPTAPSGNLSPQAIAAVPAPTVPNGVAPAAAVPKPSGPVGTPQATVEPPAIPDGTAAPQAPAGSQAIAESADGQPVAAGTAEAELSGPTVELRGVMQKEGAQPRFRIILNAAGGRNRTMDIVLGETVYGPWKASEYNATSKKLTLSNAKRMVVLDTGETVELPE